MSDLRAAVEGLEPPERDWPWESTVNYNLGWDAALAAVLALIPEGAVLVTEETLAAAMHTTWPHDRAISADHCSCEHRAAAILRHLREGT